MNSIFERYLETPLGIPEFLNTEFKKNGQDDWAPIILNTPDLIDEDFIEDFKDINPDELHVNLEKNIIEYSGDRLISTRALYSYLKALWVTADKEDNHRHMSYEFPMIAITNEQFEFKENWIPEKRLIDKLVLGGIYIKALNEKYASIVCLGDCYNSVVIVISENNRRKIQHNRYFMIKETDNIIILRNCIDWINKKQFWEEKDVKSFIGVNHYINQCYRIPVA